MKVIITQFAAPPPLPAALAGGIVAQPGAQVGATALRAKLNVVVNVLSGGAVKLEVILGYQQTVFNRSGASCPIYPTEGTQIEGYGLNVPQIVANGATVIFTFDGVQTWLVS